MEVFHLKELLSRKLGSKKEKLKKFAFINLINDKINRQRLNNVQDNLDGMLEKFIDVCKEERMEYWLDFGTLLGCIREGGFLAHDLDLDVGVFYKEKQHDKFLSKLEEKGFRLTKTFIYFDAIVEQSFFYNHVNFDILYYYKNAQNKLISYNFEYKKNRESATDIVGYEYSNQYAGLKEAKMGKIPVFIPANANEILRTYYGDSYLVPDKNFDFKSMSTYRRIEDGNFKIVFY